MQLDYLVSIHIHFPMMLMTFVLFAFTMANAHDWGVHAIVARRVLCFRERIAGCKFWRARSLQFRVVSLVNVAQPLLSMFGKCLRYIISYIHPCFCSVRT